MSLLGCEGAGVQLLIEKGAAVGHFHFHRRVGSLLTLRSAYKSVRTMAGYGDPEWLEARGRAKRRDQYRCQYCGHHEGITDSPLEVHHLKPVGQGGSHRLSNLITLCKKCHSDLHSHNPNADYLPPELLDEIKEPPQHLIYRSEPRPSGKAIIEYLKENGPAERSDIINAVDYTESTVSTQLTKLYKQKYLCRISRGEYAYITELAYRDMLAEDSDKYDRVPVRIWLAGEQENITEYTS